MKITLKNTPEQVELVKAMASRAVLGLEVHHLEDTPLSVVLVALVIEVVENGGYVAITGIPTTNFTFCPKLSISSFYRLVVILDINTLDPKAYVLVRLRILSEIVL